MQDLVLGRTYVSHVSQLAAKALARKQSAATAHTKATSAKSSASSSSSSSSPAAKKSGMSNANAQARVNPAALSSMFAGQNILMTAGVAFVGAQLLVLVMIVVTARVRTEIGDESMDEYGTQDSVSAATSDVNEYMYAHQGPRHRTKQSG
jgi:hypothetical protein